MLELPIKINDSGTTALLPVTLLATEILLRTGGGPVGMVMFFKLRPFLVSLAAVFVLSHSAPPQEHLHDETKMAAREIRPFSSCLNPLF